MNSPMTSTSDADLSPKTAARIFWSVTLGFSLLWILLPTLLHPTYRMDVMELTFIGKEWVLSTRKHPMLPAWMLETLFMLTNRAFAAPFIASALCTLTSLWAVWSLGRQVLSQRMALVGVFAMLPYWFFSTDTVTFNQNIPLVTLWTLSIYLVFRAVQTGRLRFWLGTGITLGLAFHSKYSAVFLVISLLVFMVFHPQARKYWKTPGPYLTTLLATVIFLPHLIWLYHDDFSTIAYAQPKLKRGITFLPHLMYPLRFFLSEVGYLLLPTLALTPILGFRWRPKSENTPHARLAQSLLVCCMAVPLGLHLLAAGITTARINSEYGAAFWPYFGVLVLLTFQPKTVSHSLRNVLRWVVCLEAVLVGIFLVQAFYSPLIMKDVRQFHFPAQSLGQACQRIWSERYNTPCPYITGDWRHAGYASLAMKDNPSVLFYYNNIDDPDALPTGTWATDADFNRSGGVIVWKVSEEEAADTPPGGFYVPPYVKMRFPSAEVLPEPLIILYEKYPNIPPEKVGVAIVPPL